jgi:hypothetical protein
MSTLVTRRPAKPSSSGGGRAISNSGLNDGSPICFEPISIEKLALALREACGVPLMESGNRAAELIGFLGTLYRRTK